MISFDILPYQWEDTTMESDADVSLADFWLSLAYEDLAGTADHLLDEENETTSHYASSALDDRSPISPNTDGGLSEETDYSENLCGETGCSQKMPIANTQHMQTVYSEQRSWDTEPTMTPLQADELRQTTQAKQTKLAVQGDTSDSKSNTEASDEFPASCFRACTPQTTDDADSAPIQSGPTRMMQAESSQPIDLTRSEDTFTRANHCMRASSVHQTPQKSKRHPLPTTTRKRKASRPRMGGENKRWKPSGEFRTLSTTHKSSLNEILRPL